MPHVRARFWVDWLQNLEAGSSSERDACVLIPSIPGTQYPRDCGSLSPS